MLVEPAQQHHAIGNHYHVRIDLAVPGEDIIVAHDASLHATAQDTNMEQARKADEADPAHKHARVAVHEAFDIARRRLQDHSRRVRSSH